MKKTFPDTQGLLADQGGCGRMLAISEDFHKLLRASCQKCADGTGVCMARALQDAVAQLTAVPVPADSEPVCADGTAVH
jgi:hypothetical protein